MQLLIEWDNSAYIYNLDTIVRVGSSKHLQIGATQVLHLRASYIPLRLASNHKVKAHLHDRERMKMGKCQDVVAASIPCALQTPILVPNNVVSLQPGWSWCMPATARLDELRLLYIHGCNLSLRLYLMKGEVVSLLNEQFMCWDLELASNWVGRVLLLDLMGSFIRPCAWIITSQTGQAVDWRYWSWD